MKRAITLPRPSVGFPEAGWRPRFEAAVALAERGGLALEVGLASRGAPASVLAEVEASLGALPRDLRALLEAADGGRIGHLVLHPARAVLERTPALRTRWNGLEGRASLDGVASSELFAFAVDMDGSAWAARERKPGLGHAVVYCTELGFPPRGELGFPPRGERSSPPRGELGFPPRGELGSPPRGELGLPVEHRFTTLGQFLESALVRAHAAALHRQAETLAGDDLDDGPWLDAARRLESEIDPSLLRTRDD